MRRAWLVTLLTVGIPLAASAESGYRHGRIRHVEDRVTVQRGTETGSEEAAPNMPFLPGDRVWTEEGGRAEFQFAGGSIVRLDRESKLDYVAHAEGRREQIALRLWSGALYLHARDRRDPDFEVETAGGVVATSGRSVLRIDVVAGEARVSVYEGEATVEGARAVRLRAGERLYARRGEVTEGPHGFDRAEGDEFASWNDERQSGLYASNRQGYLPEEVAPYADDLEDHGSWYYQTEVGYVWRPYVGPDWQPYSHGRWIWTVYGWTWLPYEHWGWAPFHFGRWGYSSLGWYWIPGAHWSPAWVSFAVGRNYFGWCPLGYRNRPILISKSVLRHKRLLPRSGAPSGTTARETASSPWIYVRKGDVTAREVARVRVQPEPSFLGDVRVIDPSQSRVARDLTLSEAPYTREPRNVATKPTPADTVPELRHDPMTTLPVPGSYRRMPGGGWEQAPRSVAPEPAPASAPRTASPSGAAPPQGTTPRWAPPAQGQASPDVRRSRTGEERRRAPDAPAAAPAPPSVTPSDSSRGWQPRPRSDEGARERSGSEQREVLRPLFQPLSRPRGEEPDRGSDGATPRGSGWRPAGSSREAKPREYGPPTDRGGYRAEPAARSAPPPPAAVPRDHGKAREKEKN